MALEDRPDTDGAIGMPLVAVSSMLGIPASGKAGRRPDNGDRRPRLRCLAI